jgi:hypothetical protein
MFAGLKKTENHIRGHIRFWKRSRLSGQMELETAVNLYIPISKSMSFSQSLSRIPAREAWKFQQGGSFSLWLQLL